MRPLHTGKVQALSKAWHPLALHIAMALLCILAVQVLPGSALAAQTAAYIEVPDVRGLTVDRARAAAEKNKLRLSVNEFQRTEAPKYRVSSQFPAAGTKAKARTWIKVSTVAWTEAPNVTGQRLADARDIILKYGLKPTVRSRLESDVSVETVKAQKPASGKWVRPKSTVALTVAVPAAETPAAEIIVPDVRGKTFEQAKSRAERRGLRLRTTGSQNTAAPRYRVADQSPAPNQKVEKGTWITVTMEPWTRVPNVIGASRTKAEQAIADARLKSTVTRWIKKDVKQEQVAGQEPQPGSWVKEGRRVELVVARPVEVYPGPEVKLVEVPDLVGMHYDRAQVLLERKSLFWREGQLTDSDEDVDRVRAQYPEAGELVAPKSRVTLDIELAMPKKAVPSIVGKSVARAIETVTAEGFSFETTGDPDIDRQIDRIVSQEPPAKTLARLGSTVTGTVAIPKVSVPNIVGKTLAEASQTIEDARLKFKQTGDRSARPNTDRIVAQNPRAGQIVRPGKTVEGYIWLLIPKRKPLARVPDLIGAQVSSARQTLAALSLTLFVTKPGQDPQGERTIAGQKPPAGTIVMRDSSITATLVEVIVPKVVGLTLAAARRTILDAKLTFQAKADDGALDRDAEVESQSPQAGERVKLDSLVIVTLKPKLVEVPKVVDLTLEEAERKIQEAKLTFRANVDDDDVDRNATVARQSPKAGERVKPGAQVTVTPKTVWTVVQEVLVWLKETLPLEFRWALSGVLAGVLGLAVLLLAGLWLRKIHPPPLPPRKIEVTGNRDIGLQDIEWRGPPGEGVGIRLRPTVDAGEQRLVLDHQQDETTARRYG